MLLNAGVNVRPNSSILSLRLNPLRELQCNVSEFNEFQTDGAQHLKARSAKWNLGYNTQMSASMSSADAPGADFGGSANSSVD